MSKMTVNPVSRKSDLVTQEHEKEILIYDLIIDKAFSLNETSSLIWTLCNGKNSVSEIAANLSRKLNFSVGEDFIWLALEQLKKDNLLENGEEIAIDFSGLSRRDVIRRIGFASLVALPIVSSLVAPTAIQATSLDPNRCRQTMTCTGANRTNGCSCSTATIVGTPGGGPAGGGDPSNCASGLSCYSALRPDGTTPRLSACCQSSTQL